MSQDALCELLAEQVDYYRARAREYDATTGGPDAARLGLLEALRAFNPAGRVLELACGTGVWTSELAWHSDELTAIDAAPEMLALAARRVSGDHVHFVQADLFDWRPEQSYDVVFFASWLSHVPPQRFEAFWDLVADCLSPSGRVFCIDEAPSAAVNERFIPGAVAPAVRRRLTGGACHRAVKVFYEPQELEQRLADLGWRVKVTTFGARFFAAWGPRPRLARGLNSRFGGSRSL